MTYVDKESTANSSDEVSLRDFISKINKWYRYLLSTWVVIVTAGFIGGLIGLTYAFLQKPIYTAELSFALEDDNSTGGGLGAAMGLASQFGVDLGGSSGGGAFAGDNILALMKSRSMIESALLTAVNVNGKKQTLAEVYISFNKLREGWKDKPGLTNIRFLPNVSRSKFSLQQDSVLGTFYESIIKSNLTVEKVDKKLSIITVKVNSTDELFSKNFTEVLTETVSNFYITSKTKRSVQNVNVLQRQTDSVRRELNAAIGGVASSVDFNPNPNPTLQILRVPSQRRQVDVQANQTILTQLVANLELSKLSLRKETPLIQVIDKPILPLKKEKTGKLKGLLTGALFIGLLTSVYVIIRKLYIDIMISDGNKR